MGRITKEELIDKVEWIFLITISYLISEPLSEVLSMEPVASITIGIVLLVLVLYFFDTTK